MGSLVPWQVRRFLLFLLRSPLLLISVFIIPNRELAESLVSPDDVWRLLEATGQSEVADAVWQLAETDPEQRSAEHDRLLRSTLLPLCARYLCGPHSTLKELDPVARFHLGNGAIVHELHYVRLFWGPFLHS